MLEPLILVGHRGTGKSTLGRALAERLDLPFLDLDLRFEERHGPISSFVANRGWPAFRTLESSLLTELRRLPCVIACGGGVIEATANRECLNTLGTVIHLVANEEILIRRMLTDPGRPPLELGAGVAAETRSALGRRLPLFRAVATHEIDTGTGDFEVCLARLVALALRPRLCLSIGSVPNDLVLELLASPPREAGCLELRLDLLPKLTDERLTTALPGCPLPVVLTLRLPDHGGTWNRDETARGSILEGLLRTTDCLVDLEHGTDACRILLDQGYAKRMIVSWHDLRGTPAFDVLQTQHRAMAAMGCLAVKLVTTAHDLGDQERVLHLLDETERTIAFCMGSAGTTSRLLAPTRGSLLCYAPPSTGATTAPGQLDLHTLSRRFDLDRAERTTKVLGIVAEHPHLSFSPLLHNPLLRHHGVPAVYLAFQVERGRLPSLLPLLRHPSFLGASVTMPHKVDFLPLLDQLDPLAAAVGAVNTVVVSEERLVGYNTDVLGAVSALEEMIRLEATEALVLGTGGAARAVVVGLLHAGARVSLWGRNEADAAGMALAFGVAWISTSELAAAVPEHDVVVNATSAGMPPALELTPVPPALLRPRQVLMDLVTSPLHTTLVRAALAKGCRVVTGERMLLHQAAAQFRLWTGLSPEPTYLETVLARAFSGTHEEKPSYRDPVSSGV